jgi:glycosyltransferase involved in cell wall biosynthesis
MPSVSAIVAVYNGARFIADALSSIVGQTAPPDEVLVIDDGSTDGTGDVVARFPRVRSLRRDANGGQASALNWGVASARGAYLAFLDADDVWAPDKLARQLAAFEEDPALDVVYGQARTRILGGGGDDAWTKLGLPSAVHRGRAGEPSQGSPLEDRVLPAFLPSAMLIRRAAFARVGDFDPGFKLGSVVDWYARSREAGLVERALDAVVYERRIHGDNVGIRQRGDRDEYLRVVKAALERRRRSGESP